MATVLVVDRPAAGDPGGVDVRTDADGTVTITAGPPASPADPPAAGFTYRGPGIDLADDYNCPPTRTYEIRMPPSFTAATLAALSAEKRFADHSALPLPRRARRYAGSDAGAVRPDGRPRGAARNAPCPCGSGKKRKRCCG